MRITYAKEAEEGGPNLKARAERMLQAYGYHAIAHGNVDMLLEAEHVWAVEHLREALASGRVLLGASSFLGANHSRIFLEQRAVETRRETTRLESEKNA